MTNLPKDWQKYHDEQLARLDPELRKEAVAMLRHELQGVLPQVRASIMEDPQEWWVTHHFFWGMGVRNLLRKHGFTDDRMGDNLDVFWVGLVEEAASQ